MKMTLMAVTANAMSAVTVTQGLPYPEDDDDDHSEGQNPQKQLHEVSHAQAKTEVSTEAKGGKPAVHSQPAPLTGDDARLPFSDEAQRRNIRNTIKAQEVNVSSLF